MLQAPGIYEGYAPEAFPGVVHALREGDWNTAFKYTHLIGDLVEAAAAALAPPGSAFYYAWRSGTHPPGSTAPVPTPPEASSPSSSKRSSGYIALVVFAVILVVVVLAVVGWFIKCYRPAPRYKGLDEEVDSAVDLPDRR